MAYQQTIQFMYLTFNKFASVFIKNSMITSSRTQTLPLKIYTIKQQNYIKFNKSFVFVKYLTDNSKNTVFFESNCFSSFNSSVIQFCLFCLLCQKIIDVFFFFFFMPEIYCMI